MQLFCFPHLLYHVVIFSPGNILHTVQQWFKNSGSPGVSGAQMVQAKTIAVEEFCSIAELFSLAKLKDMNGLFEVLDLNRI